MRLKSKAIFLVLALAVSACANQGNTNLGGTAGGAGVAGDVGDPRSPAYFQQTIGDRVLFEVDQSVLTPTALATLQQQAEWLMTNGEYTAIIEGHADEQGTREYNQALSEKRANAVKDFLVSRGVSSARLRTLPLGKERPIAICSEESCYAQNRRAVTVISAGASS
ncbi:MAG: peptidoglycan-associated lipoprotein Pal [Marinosulfonomonas sp.]